MAFPFIFDLPGWNDFFCFNQLTKELKFLIKKLSWQNSSHLEMETEKKLTIREIVSLTVGILQIIQLLLSIYHNW